MWDYPISFLRIEKQLPFVHTLEIGAGTTGPRTLATVRTQERNGDKLPVVQVTKVRSAANGDFLPCDSLKSLHRERPLCGAPKP